MTLDNECPQCGAQPGEPCEPYYCTAYDNDEKGTNNDNDRV